MVSITVTKIASAYVDLEENTTVTINADLIRQIIPIAPEKELGNAILFFYDGSSMNIAETLEQIQKKVLEKKQHYFQKGFSKN